MPKCIESNEKKLLLIFNFTCESYFSVSASVVCWVFFCSLLSLFSITKRERKCPPSFTSIITSSMYLSSIPCPLTSITKSPSFSPALWPEPPRTTCKRRGNIGVKHIPVFKQHPLVCLAISPYICPTWLIKVPGVCGSQPKLKPKPKGPFWRTQSR